MEGQRRLEELKAYNNSNASGQDAEYEAFMKELYGEAGISDFSDEARQRLEEGMAYEEHLRQMAQRDGQNLEGAPINGDEEIELQPLSSEHEMMPVVPENAPWTRNDALRVVMVDQQKDAEAMAREAAHRRLEAEMESDMEKLGRIQNFFKNKIWKGALGRELIINRYKQEALDNIKANKSILINHDISPEQQDKINQTTIARFMQEGDEMIHQMAGEKKQFIDDTTESGRAMKNIIYELLEQKMRQPDLEAGSFDELVKLKMNEYQRQYHDEALLQRGDFYIDNIAAIADIAREKAEHVAVANNLDRDEAIRQVLAEVEIYTGESRNTARTEMRLTKTERLIERLNQDPSTSRLLVKPEMVAAGVAVASGVANFLFKRVGRSTVAKAIPVFGGAIASGAIGGIEEAYRQEEARNLQQRQLAQGGEVASLADAERQRLEQFAYETVTANELIEDFELGFANLPDLRSDLSPEDEKVMIDAWIAEKQASFDGDPAGFVAEIAGILHNEISHVAYTDSRIKISDTNKIDLIHYDSLEAMQQQRWDIDVKKAQMNVLLRKIMTARPDVATEVFAMDNLATTGDLKQDYRKLVGTIEEVFNEGAENDIDVKDKAFRNFKRKQVFQKVMTETAKGAVIGLAFQEVRAFFDDSLHGVVEGLAGKQTYAPDAEVQDTLLARLTGLRAETLPTKSGFLEQEVSQLGSLGNVESIKLDGGFQMMADEQSGGVDIFDRTGKLVINDLRFDSHGNLSPDSLKLLQENGFAVDVDSATVVDKIEQVTKKVNAQQFLNQNRGDMLKTSIRYWYDNDTSYADSNELRLDLELGKNGEIKLLTNRMVAGGSTHGSNVADNLSQKIFISATRSSQKLNFDFQPDANGIVTITPDSPAYQLFSIQGQEVDFNGGFIQAASELGLNNKGEMMIAPLATISGNDSFKDSMMTESVKQLKQVFNYTITAPEVKVNLMDNLALPPFIPIYTHRELPPIRYGRTNNIEPQIGEVDYYLSYNNGQSSIPNYNKLNQPVSDSEQIERDRQIFYPNMGRQALDNDLGRVMQWYDQNIEQQNGKQYAEWVKKKVTEAKLDRLSAETKAVMHVPVYAAGESEANKLGDILRRGYAEQIKRNNQQKEVAIFLNVNWRYQDQNDPVKLANIQKTVDTIKQFQADNPDVQVYAIYNTFTDAQLKASGNAINQITKHNIDILLSAMGQNIRKGRASKDFNPLLIRNDADVEALDKDYFKNMINVADRLSDVEVFGGVTYFDRKLAQRNPVLSLGLEMLQAMNIYSKARGSIHTAGANFALRAKSVAETGFGFNGQMFQIGADDVQFGMLLKRKRNVAEADGQVFNDRLGRLIGNARLITNADRQERSYVNGYNGIDPWSDCGSFYDENGNYVGRSDIGGGSANAMSDMELGQNLSEPEAKLELKKRLERNLSLVLEYNNPEDYHYGRVWLKHYLNIPQDRDDQQYYTIKDGKITFTAQGLDLVYDRLIRRNAEFCQFLQDKTDYWNIL